MRLTPRPSAFDVRCLAFRHRGDSRRMSLATLDGDEHRAAMAAFSCATPGQPWTAEAEDIVHELAGAPFSYSYGLGWFERNELLGLAVWRPRRLGLSGLLVWHLCVLA